MTGRKRFRKLKNKNKIVYHLTIYIRTINFGIDKSKNTFLLDSFFFSNANKLNVIENLFIINNKILNLAK